MAVEFQAELESALVPLRERLVSHPLYASLRDEHGLRLFMEAHVFAVWDFQSLLKALQRSVTCIDVPWVPTADPEARRLVNEIVLAEESDEAPAGGYLSHYELYHQAMQECGANTEPIEAFVASLCQSGSVGDSVDQALEASAAPPCARLFVNTTMTVARCGEAHRIAAAFAYGREDVIPAMFRQLVDQLAAASPGSWSTLRYYLERHIGLDSEEHGPQAAMLLRRLCRADEALWAEATEAAVVSLEARVRFWDGIAAGVSGAGGQVGGGLRERYG